MSANKAINSTPPDAGRFATTHWSVVLAAGSPKSSHYQEALEILCRTYWFPIYVYLRRLGYNRQHSEDYTQGFFTQLLEKQYLSQIESNSGKFRSFLLVVLRHFLADERDREQAIKRGGGKKAMSLDVDSAETRFSTEPSHHLTPEKIFNRCWALTVLEKTMDRLETEMASMNKQRLFESLKDYLCGETASIPYRNMAAQLDMTEGAVKVAVHRLRRRYRELLRDEIAQTVSSRAQVEDEIKDLFNALTY